MHVRAWLPTIPNILHRVADLVSNLHIWLLDRIGRVERLVVRETIQVLIVLIHELFVRLHILVCLEVVKEAEQDL